ncbi:MAG TPA: hypothetical protein VMV10_19675 [Pirellulales bacterium]|nr:hypothetical protein [Pirellulales bacterium]
MTRDLAVGSYHTRIDPLTNKPVCNAKHMGDWKLQREGDHIRSKAGVCYRLHRKSSQRRSRKIDRKA